MQHQLQLHLILLLVMGNEVLSPCSFRFTFVLASLGFTFYLFIISFDILAPKDVDLALLDRKYMLELLLPFFLSWQTVMRLFYSSRKSSSYSLLTWTILLIQVSSVTFTLFDAGIRVLLEDGIGAGSFAGVLLEVLLFEYFH